MKWILIFLCLPVFGQLPVLPFAPSASSSTISPALFMPGLAEYWEFTSTSLTTNATVTNWIGALQHTVLTNGNASLRPTNSASGVGFAGTQSLTNTLFPVGSNWTASIFYKFTGPNLNSPATLFGSNNVSGNNATFVIALQDGGTGKQNPYYSSSSGSSLATDGNSPFIPVVSDLTITVSNNANGGNGTILFWTNGVLNSMNYAFPGVDKAPEAISSIGKQNAGPNGGGASQFTGFIQGLYLMTNFVCTQAVASNIHYYRTNFLTPGATP